MKSPHTDTSPSRKTICTIITASAPQVCLPSNPRPPTPHLLGLLTLLMSAPFLAAFQFQFHTAEVWYWKMTFILLIIMITTTTVIIIIIIHSFFFFLYMGLRRYSSAVVLKDPLYYMGWSESLSWNEKKIITENWCLGDALEPLITSGTAEVTEKCCEVSSWSSVHECCRSLSKNKWLSKIYLSLKLTGNCLWDK